MTRRSQSNGLERLLERLYEVALLALPRWFRVRWGADMRETFGTRLREALDNGFLAVTRTGSRELGSVALAAFQSRVEQASGRVHRAHDAQDGSDVWRTDPEPAPYFQRHGTRLKLAGVGALACHFALFMIVFPGLGEGGPRIPPPEPDIWVIKKLPPPPKEEVQVEKVQTEVSPAPLPDPTPSEPSPLIEQIVEPVAASAVAVAAEFPAVVTPPAPPAPPAPVVEERKRAGSEVEFPRLLERVQPDYPEIAVRARHECTVILEAVIGKAGDVIDARVLRGCPLGMNESAIDAVSRWRYTPTLLNGRPVEVIVTVTARYQLH